MTKIIDKRHGGLFDRGRADSYYGRPRDPHYFIGGSYDSPAIKELTLEEVAEYIAGYDHNEKFGDRKSWD